MLIRLKNVLGPRELENVQQILNSAHYVDGKLSAGDVAALVKHNQEIDAADPNIQTLNNLVMGNLLRHKTYQRAALPLKIASPFYCSSVAAAKARSILS